MEDAGVGLENCPGVRSLGIVGWACSAIVAAGSFEQRNWGKDTVALEIHPLLTQRIRAITYPFVGFLTSTYSCHLTPISYLA